MKRGVYLYLTDEVIKILKKEGINISRFVDDCLSKKVAEIKNPKPQKKETPKKRKSKKSSAYVKQYFAKSSDKNNTLYKSKVTLYKRKSIDR